MKFVNVLFVALLFVLPVEAFCDTANPTETAESITLEDPVKMLEQTTDKVLQLAEEAKGYADQDPERYHQQVEAVVEKVVDVSYFTRGVMGTYASGRLYKSLETDQERQAFRARVDRFAEKLKKSFIGTYADALLSFNGVRVELHKPRGQDDAADEMALAQTVYDEANQPYNVQYRLHRNRKGDWQVYNVIVEGVNMGATYRNQFARAVEEHGGDVDFVVDHWSQIMQNPEELTQAGKRARPQ